MNCRQTTAKLNAYLDGELPPGAMAGVQEHLQACPQCAAELLELKQLNLVLGALEGATAPGGFARRVREAAAGPVPMAGARPVGVRLAGRVLTRVAAVLMAAAGLWVGMTMGGAVGLNNGYAAESETAESEDLDLQVDALSAAPVGSVTDVYLAFVSGEE